MTSKKDLELMRKACVMYDEWTGNLYSVSHDEKEFQTLDFRNSPQSPENGSLLMWVCDGWDPEDALNGQL